MEGSGPKKYVIPKRDAIKMEDEREKLAAKRLKDMQRHVSYFLTSLYIVYILPPAGIINSSYIVISFWICSICLMINK